MSSLGSLLSPGSSHNTNLPPSSWSLGRAGAGGGGGGGGMGVGGGGPAVDVGVGDEEGVGVPPGDEEVAEGVDDAFFGEAQVFGADDGGVDHVEAEGVGAVGVEDVGGIGVVLRRLDILRPSAARTRKKGAWVLHNLLARWERASFPMIGKFFSNGWKNWARFSNDWKNFSAVFQ